MEPPFPPPSDALIVKITDEVACSSQPTKEQIDKLPSLGFASVLNLVGRSEASFFRGEEATLREVNPEIQYIHVPFLDITNSSIDYVLEQVKKIKKPALIHCDTGQRSALIAILLVGLDEEKPLNEQIIIDYGEQLNVDLKPFSRLAVIYLSEKIKSRIMHLGREKTQLLKD